MEGGGEGSALETVCLCGVWCGMCVVWCVVCGVVWCGVVWCGVVWCGVWCGVVWCVYVYREGGELACKWNTI